MIGGMDSQLFAKTLGERIAWVREWIVKIKQNELARRLTARGGEVTASHLSAIENEHRKPSLDLLARIAKELNTTTDYLLGLTEHAYVPGREEETVAYKPEAQEAAQIIDNLESPTLRANVLEIVKEFTIAEENFYQRQDEEFHALAESIEVREGIEARLAFEQDVAKRFKRFVPRRK